MSRIEKYNHYPEISFCHPPKILVSHGYCLIQCNVRNSVASGKFSEMDAGTNKGTNSVMASNFDATSDLF